jgi:hypothetical protein
MRLFLYAVAAVCFPLLIASPATACSKGSFSIPLSATQLFFTGVATADTLPAGPGTVGYSSRAGHSGPANHKPIHGQVIRTDRIGGPAAEQLSGEVREVVVVPWGYDTACRPLVLGGSFRWVEPGTAGFYIAVLRAPEHWVDGKPTVDLHNPGHLPYTGTERIREMGRDTAVASLLSPDQIFDFYQAAPFAAEVVRLRSESLEPLRSWAIARPDLARRPPAERLLDWVLGSVGETELEQVDHPVLGTWRFTLRVPGGSAHSFYARTEQRPTGYWTPSRAGPESTRESLRLPPVEGYSFRVVVASELGGLPEMIRQPDDFEAAALQARTTQWAYINSMTQADSAGADELLWRGRLESSLLRTLPDEPLIQRAAAQANERFSIQYRAGLPYETPAQFSRGADGVLRVRQVFPVADGEDFILEGEQLSRTVIRIGR